MVLQLTLCERYVVQCIDNSFTEESATYSSTVWFKGLYLCPLVGATELSVKIC